MEQHETEAALLPNIANQMRSLLSNLYLAASQVIPPEQREQDPALDAKAAILEQSFFRLLRLYRRAACGTVIVGRQITAAAIMILAVAEAVKFIVIHMDSSFIFMRECGIIHLDYYHIRFS